ncbi:MAG: hypothetical protein COA45_08135 [Zetaproteobacteria bacterium]|nr:MAG: hypothetical protein COA45_08135 [Zetaproteobacteria bacterium]
MSAPKDRISTAIICCLAAHFMFAIMGTCAKYLAETHHVAEIAFYRNIIVFVPFFMFMIIRKNRHLFKTNKPKLIAIRAIVGGVSLMVTFAALAQLPMAYATVLFFASSFLTPALAFFFLKEHVGIHRWAAIAIGMCGVLVIAQPSGTISLIGLALALTAAALHSAMYTILRSLKSESPITITFYFVIAGILIPGIFMPWVAKPIITEEIWVFLLIGFSGGIAQIFLSNAYKYAPASLVTPFSYTALLWTVLIDIYIWEYDLAFIPLMIGAALIITAQLYIIYREYINKIKRHNQYE